MTHKTTKEVANAHEEDITVGRSIGPGSERDSGPEGFRARLERFFAGNRDETLSRIGKIVQGVEGYSPEKADGQLDAWLALEGNPVACAFTIAKQEASEEEHRQELPAGSIPFNRIAQRAILELYRAGPSSSTVWLAKRIPELVAAVADQHRSEAADSSQTTCSQQSLEIVVRPGSQTRTLDHEGRATNAAALEKVVDKS